MYNKKRKEDKLMDMLVNLYDLKESKEEEKTFQIQRILSPNIYLLEEFIKKYFHPGWASEAKAACYKANRLVLSLLWIKKLSALLVMMQQQKVFLDH